MNEKGSFKGGLIFDNKRDFEKKLINSQYSINLIEENIEKIARHYTSLGAKKIYSGRFIFF